MLNVIKDHELEQLINIPDKIEENTDLSVFATDLTVRSGKTVLVTREGDNAVVRQLLNE